MPKVRIVVFAKAENARQAPGPASRAAHPRLAGGAGAAVVEISQFQDRLVLAQL
jgi:hypothetical protein